MQRVEVLSRQAKIHLLRPAQDVMLHERSPLKQVVKPSAYPAEDLLYGSRVLDES